MSRSLPTYPHMNTCNYCFPLLTRRGGGSQLVEAPVIRQGEPQQPVDTEVLGFPKGPTTELQLRAFRVLQVRTVCTSNTVAGL